LDPIVCCASTTTAGAAARALEALNRIAIAGMDRFRVHTEFALQDFDGVTDMPTLFLNIRNRLFVLGEGCNMKQLLRTNEQ
jgi:hypothetical protein